MDLASQLLVCLAVAAGCAGVTRRVPAPLPLVQTVAGAALAWPLGMHLPLEPHAFLLLLIPPLLYLDGARIPKEGLRNDRRPILMMAFGLVVLTVLSVGLLIDYLVAPIPRPVAFAIAAALSPTDAVAVAGMVGRARVPPRLMTILQGEALFNDASGLVSMRVAVAAMLTGAFSWPSAIASFGVVAIGGVAVGVAMTWLFVRALRLLLGTAEGDTGPRILMMLVFPYAAYLAAEHLHLSGILAAAAAGMVSTRFNVVDRGHRATRLQSAAVNHMVETALNGLVFVLLGLQLPTIVGEVDAIARDAALSPGQLAATIGAILAALVAVRFAWVWISLQLALRRGRVLGATPRGPTLRLIAATAVAGVRGAVSLAAALTLPLTMADGSKFPAREVAIFLCAAVIVVWLIGASVGLPILLRTVKLPDDTAEADHLRTRARLAEAAIAELEHQPPSVAADHVLELYRARLIDPDEPGDRPTLERELRLLAIASERRALRALFAAREIDEAMHQRITHELDLIEEALARPRARH
ncbi:MAG TPA: Na+/H+ antiporter [Kofleriaceae bacterium]|nr:Na+/H+ antiporter [Kofleriaceae bacterium]